MSPLLLLLGLWLAGGCGRGEWGPTGPTDTLPGRHAVAASPDGSDGPDRERVSFPVAVTATPTGPGRWHVRTVVGPLDRAYQTVSVPFYTAARVTRYAFPTPQHVVGCGRAWTPRPGGTGAIEDIPLSCAIPGTPHRSGAATAAAPWVELTGPAGRLRRTPTGGPWRALSAVRHTAVAGLVAEVSFQREPVVDQPPLSPGTVLILEEELVWSRP